MRALCPRSSCRSRAAAANRRRADEYRTERRGSARAVHRARRRPRHHSARARKGRLQRRRPIRGGPAAAGPRRALLDSDRTRDRFHREPRADRLGAPEHRWTGLAHSVDQVRGDRGSARNRARQRHRPRGGDGARVRPRRVRRRNSTGMSEVAQCERIVAGPGRLRRRGRARTRAQYAGRAARHSVAARIERYAEDHRSRVRGARHRRRADGRQRARTHAGRRARHRVCAEA